MNYLLSLTKFIKTRLFILKMISKLYQFNYFFTTHCSFKVAFNIGHVRMLRQSLKITTFAHVLLMPVTSSVEQVICRIGDDIFQLIGSTFGDSAVIEFVPFVVDWILSKCGVVTEAHVAVVIGYRVAVVYKLFFEAAVLVDVSKNILAHVKALEWEINLQVDLLIVAHSSHHAVHTKSTL